MIYKDHFNSKVQTISERPYLVLLISLTHPSRESPLGLKYAGQNTGPQDLVLKHNFY